MKLLPTACLVMMVFGPETQQAPPRDIRAPATAEATLVKTLRAAIVSGKAAEAAYFQLADLLKSRDDPDGADAVLLAARDAYPASVRAQTAAAGVYNRRGDFDACIAALRAVAALQPQSAEAQHRIAVFLWDKARGDPKLDPATKLSYILQGIEAENQALSLQPDYADAMTYKNILLRLQANMSTNPAEQAQLIAEADALRNRVIALQRQKQTGNSQAAEPAASAGFDEAFDQTAARLTPVRVGAGIRTPTKIRDVRPRYPPEALSSRVQGVVIIEALIDDTGSVANARVLRSIPMLDAAAIAAVSQWVFTPTELNGRPVPVIMTVTVNFTIQP